MVVPLDGRRRSTDTLARPVVARRLAEALELGGLLLVAPAGSGTTTALRDALAREGGIVAWIRCAESDRDAGLVLARTLDALAAAAPGLADAFAERRGGRRAGRPGRGDAPARGRVWHIAPLKGSAPVRRIETAHQLRPAPRTAWSSNRSGCCATGCDPARSCCVFGTPARHPRRAADKRCGVREVTLRRGLTILAELAGADNGSGRFTVSQLARMLDVHRSQVSRTLQVLQEEGFVDKDDEGYKLGWRVYVLGRHAGNRRLHDSADVILRILVASLNERCYLSVLQGTNVVNVCSKSPGRGVEVVDWIGHTRPAHATSSGRALLIDTSRESLEQLFTTSELIRVGPQSPVDVEDLYNRIGQARRDGYALADEEIEPGVLSVAVPVRSSGSVIAAVGFSAPKYRIEDNLAPAIRLLRRAGQQLTQQLSAAGPTGSNDNHA